MNFMQRYHLNHINQVNHSSDTPAMKISLLLIIFFGFTRLLTAQPLTGTYVSSQDTTPVFINLPLSNYVPMPNVRFNKDHTYQYSWNFPSACIMGTITGTWTMDDSLLILRDSAYQYIGAGMVGSEPIKTPNRTVFTIYNNMLCYYYTVTGKEEQRIYTRLMPDLRFYKE